MKDLSSPASRIAALLKERGETLAVAESSAGGLISAALLAVPGASSYFLGGAVVYTKQSREALLGIEAASLEGLRPSTEPYALLLSNAVRQRVGATWAIAETGATGPTPNRYGDANGHACLAITGPAQRTLTVETGLSDRAANMNEFAAAALELLAATLKERRS